MSAEFPSSRTGMRDVQRSLTAAADSQIARVVAMVDGLADRSAADALIDPLRPRLAQLRPPRPLRLTRLLFAPLDRIIVPAPRWRPDQPAVPRTALVPLADAVRAASPAIVDRTEALLAAGAFQPAAVADARAALWPAASRALLAPGAAPPPSWVASGLPETAFPALARAVGAVFAEAGAIEQLTAEARFGLPVAPASVERILLAVAARSAAAADMAVAILLAELPDPAPIVARLAADLAHAAGSPTRARAEHLTDALLERLDGPDGEGSVAASPLASAGAELRRATLLLDAIDRPGTSPSRRERVRALRGQLDGTARARFSAGVADEFTAPLRAQLAERGEVRTTELEGAARALRRLEAAGRKLGGGAFYEDLLRRTSAEVSDLSEGPNLTRADKLRLVELLAGSDAAAALLAA